MFQVYSKVIQLYTHIHVYVYIYVYILFQILFHFRLLQDTEYSSQCYTIGPCCNILIFKSLCNSEGLKHLQDWTMRRKGP